MIKRQMIAMMCAVTLIAAADWNQWRGAARDGRTDSFQVPKAYPAELKQSWSAEVGIGYSSPVVEGSRAFVLARVGEQEVVSAFDLATGKPLWKDSYAVPYQMNPAATGHGKGPKSTPVVSAGKLYTFGIDGTLSCYDSSSGKVLWRNDFKKEFSVTAADFGTAMSPLVHQGAVIVHAGGPGKGAILALDAASGKERWRWSADDPAYASPIIVTIAGAPQIVTQTRQFILGLSAAKGELLWKIPFTTDYDQNSITPVVYKDLLIVSGLDKGTFGVRIEKSPQGFAPKTVWQVEKPSMYLSSPVVVGDYLYGLTYTRKGQYFCLDARTGAQQWISNGAEGENASIAVAGNQLFLLNDTGELTIASASPKAFEVQKKYTVAKSSTWGHLALVREGILVKDHNSLILWSVQ